MRMLVQYSGGRHCLARSSPGPPTCIPWTRPAHIHPAGPPLPPPAPQVRCVGTGLTARIRFKEAGLIFDKDPRQVGGWRAWLAGWRAGVVHALPGLPGHGFIAWARTLAHLLKDPATLPPAALLLSLLPRHPVAVRHTHPAHATIFFNLSPSLPHSPHHNTGARLPGAKPDAL